jgi:8-oxo-dGTP pyrophosphatase MutT (NUDIX family)
MMSKESLLLLVSEYVALFPDDEPETIAFSEYLLRNKDEGLYDRKNFDGHITTSAFIVDLPTGEMLLLRHKSLNRWLQPGGHTEGDISLQASALREAVEETGIPEHQLTLRSVHPNQDIPFDIDSHYIPANPRKDEDGHYHHDIRYVFDYTGNRNNSFNTDEATGMQWVTFEALKTDETFSSVVGKIAATIL